MATILSFRKHFACPFPSCSISCPRNHDNDCTCCGTSRGFFTFFLWIIALGFLGYTVGYEFGVFLIHTLNDWRNTGINALIDVPWYIEPFLPVIDIPNVSISAIIDCAMFSGLIIGLLIGFFVGLSDIILLRRCPCDYCGRVLTGSAVVTYCKKCKKNFCFDCCFK